MKRLNWTQDLRDRLGLTHVFNRVQTASPLSRKQLLQAEYFTPADRDRRLKYFQYMKRLKDVVTSSESGLGQTYSDLSDLRDLSEIAAKLSGGLELDVTDLFLLKKHVTLEQRLLCRPDLLKAAGIRLHDHAKILALLSGTRAADIQAPVRLALSDFDDGELKKQRATAAALQRRLADSVEPDLSDLFRQIEAAEAVVRASEGKLLAWLTKNLLPYGESLLANQQKLVDLDLMLAKLRLARETGNEAVSLDSHRLAFVAMSHPEEANRLRAGGSRFTALDLSVRAGVTVIQGANMSGKSVALNTAFLNALLVNLGFYPFAKSARVPLFDTYLWIGDVRGDRQQGLSTFGAEVDQIRRAVDLAAEGPSLIVIDEPFRGTNPGEGQWLASGLAAYADTLPSFTLIATHYTLCGEARYRRYRSGDIDVPAGLTDDYELAVRQLSERVDYQLKDITGETAVPQKAMAIAGWLGLQEGILAQAARFKLDALENMNGKT